MDYRAADFWLTVAQWVFNVIVVIWMAVGRKRQADKQRVRKVEDRIALIEQDVGPCKEHRKQTGDLGCAVTELKAEVKHLPSQHSVDELNKTIGELKGQVNGLANAVDLMNQFLINQGGK